MDCWLYAGAPLAGLIGMMSGGYWGVGCGWFVVPAMLVAGADWQTAVGVSLLQMMLSTVPTVWRQLPQIGWKTGDYGRSLALPICLAAVTTSLFGKLVSEQLETAFGSEAPVKLVFIFFVTVICAQTAFSRTACYGTEAVAISRRQSLRGGVYGAVAGLVSSICGIGGGLFIRPLLTTIFRVPEYYTSRIVRLSVLLTTGAGGMTYLFRGGDWDWRVLALAALAAAGGLIGFPLGTKLHGIVYDAGYAQHIHKSFSLIALFSVFGAVFNMVGWQTAGHIVILVGAVGVVAYLLGFTAYARRHPVEKVCVR